MSGRPTGTNWHREAVAGKNWERDGVWDSIGELQLAFLKKKGMKPQHRLLDVGCGCFRAGVHFMRYLEDGNYYAIDKEGDLVEAGLKVEMPLYGIADKHPHVSVTENFGLHAFPGVQFDYAMAHSIFTHLVPELIEVCLGHVVPRLSADGVFYATYHEPPDGKVDKSRPLAGFQAWRKNERHHARYPFRVFEAMTERLGIRVENVGAWGHPYNAKGFQLMLGFRRQA